MWSAADGWLHTGDVATIDEDAYVTIIDRNKELIIDAAGKNMSPANIEVALKGALPLIDQAYVIDDGRPCNVALLVLDSDSQRRYEIMKRRWFKRWNSPIPDLRVRNGSSAGLCSTVAGSPVGKS